MNAFALMFTEADNRTHDLFKYLALVAIVVALGLEIFAVVYRAQVFDMQTYGIGVGALFAGMGAALLMKKDAPIPATAGMPGSTSTPGQLP